MANKDRQKRSARQARARERAERVETADSESKVEAVQTKSVQAKPAKERKSGFFSGIVNYFREVKSELKRVVWPSKLELKNYSVAIICALVVFGVALWLVDTGFVALLVGFTGLRG